MIPGFAQLKMIMNVKESIHRFVLESPRSKDVMSVFKTPKWFFFAGTDVLQCCNIPSLAKILSRPGGHSEPSCIEQKYVLPTPTSRTGAEDRWWKPKKSHTQNSQNIPRLCCCPDCSNFFLIPMEHLPEASGHHLMHNRVASSQQHHLPQGDHPLTMLERSRRYAYTWTRSLYKLPMSITSFICWLCASIAPKYVSMMYIWLWHIVYDYNGLSYVCFLKNMSAKSLSITSRVL